MEDKNNSQWKILFWIVLILVFVLAISITAKVSYSVGYEEGQTGIITLMQLSYETGYEINHIPGKENSKLIKFLKRLKFTLISVVLRWMDWGIGSSSFDLQHGPTWNCSHLGKQPRGIRTRLQWVGLKLSHRLLGEYDNKSRNRRGGGYGK